MDWQVARSYGARISGRGDVIVCGEDFFEAGFAGEDVDHRGEDVEACQDPGGQCSGFCAATGAIGFGVWAATRTAGIGRATEEPRNRRIGQVIRRNRQAVEG